MSMSRTQKRAEDLVGKLHKKLVSRIPKKFLTMFYEYATLEIFCTADNPRDWQIEEAKSILDKYQY